MKNTMRAAVLHGIGDLRIERISVPECKPDEVLVRVRRCGICGSDIPRVFTKGTYRFPTVPGHEFAGEIAASPDGEDIGRRVAVFPLIPCMRCGECAKENYAMCENYDYYGSRRDGGFAEYIPVKRFNLVPVPDNVSFDEAAMCEPLAVALHAVRRAGIKRGDGVVIFGAGPIGLLAAQAAESLGASSVSFVEIDSSKAEFAEKLGFGVYDGSSSSADVVIEGTGAGNALAQALDVVKREGTVLCMGNPLGEMRLSQNEYWRILRKELTVRGTWNASYAERQNDWRDAVNMLSSGKIRAKELITHRVPIDGVADIMRKMRDHSIFYVKVMIAFD